MDEKAKKSSSTAKASQDLQAQYNSYKELLLTLSSKISELESERDEHIIVLDTLKKLPNDRKCFQMIGGVLIEETIKDVVPTLNSNIGGIKKTLDQMVNDFKKVEKEMADWQKKNNVKIVSK